jgi:hypothetical protein
MMNSLLLWANLIVSGGGLAAIFIRAGRLIERVDTHDKEIKHLRRQHEDLAKAVYSK